VARRKVIAIVAAIGLTGALSLAPRSAYAAGPTQICYETAGVRASLVEPDASIDVLFDYAGAFEFTGQYNQNGNYGTVGNWADWWGQSTSGGYVLVGSTNYAASPITTQGWMVETYQCS
jgi:hypothetical protein